MVAKAEIRGWPVIGMMARACGTLFVDRASRSSALEVTEQVAERLKGPLPVLFFPEGTSTDGSEVLRFHSRLFSPAVEAGVPVTTATIRYVIEDGTPERELCWYGDALLVPHLWKALGVTGFYADVRFGEPKVYLDRREAADQTHDEIVGSAEPGACGRRSRDAAAGVILPNQIMQLMRQRAAARSTRAQPDWSKRGTRAGGRASRGYCYVGGGHRMRLLQGRSAKGGSS